MKHLIALALILSANENWEIAIPRQGAVEYSNIIPTEGERQFWNKVAANTQCED